MSLKSKIKQFINEVEIPQDRGVPFMQKLPAEKTGDYDLWQGLKRTLKKTSSRMKPRSGGFGALKLGIAQPGNRSIGGSGSPVKNIPSYTISRKQGWTNDKLTEDGHIDVPSAVRKLKLSIEDSQQMLEKLSTMSPEDSLPAWWMDKISIASNNLNKSRDYLLTSGEVSEEQLKEAISGSDRKILFILVREIVRNLKSKIKNFDVNNKSHLNRVGSSILGIIRAMSYSPDNANYKQYKKYFPKNFNSKLIQKKLKQFHSQNDKVQVTLVTQAIKNELSEGVKEGKLNEAKETIFDVAARVMKDKQMYNYKSKKGMVKVDMQTANLLVKVFKKSKPQVIKFLSELGHKDANQLMRTLWALVK